VLSQGLSLDTVPELPAVVFIRIVASTIFFAVNDLVLRGAVRRFCGGGYIWRAMNSIVTRPVPAFYIVRKGAPGVLDVKFFVIRTCHLGHTARVTFIILPARLRICHLDIVLLPTCGSIWQGVVTLTICQQRQGQDN